jgi:hypothetical protein
VTVNISKSQIHGDQLCSFADDLSHASMMDAVPARGLETPDSSLLLQTAQVNEQIRCHFWPNKSSIRADDILNLDGDVVGSCAWGMETIVAVNH